MIRRDLAVNEHVVALGALHGLAYGLLAVGLVLAFRSSRVLNLAHAQVGAVAAVLMGVAIERWDVPYWLAFPPAVLAGAALGALLELAVVRRLATAPPLLTLVATLGAAQVLVFAGQAMAGALPADRLFPEPPGVPGFLVGAVAVTPSLAALAVAGPSAAVGLWLLLTRTRLGLALRASAANPDAARLAGLRAGPLATFGWALAGGLSALAAVLLLPGGGVPGADALGPSMLLPALAAAVIAGLTSLPGALGAGVGLGVLEESARWGSDVPGAPELALLGALVVALAARRPPPLRRPDPHAWSAFEGWPPLPRAAREVPLVRWAGPSLTVIVALGALAAPLVLDPVGDVELATVACFALVALAVHVVTGLGGELSLGQFAVAGAGAVAALAADRAGAGGVAVLAAAVLAGAAVGAALMLPGLRARAFGLAIASLGFALAAPPAVFGPVWDLDARLSPIAIGPLDTATSTGAAVLAAAALVAGYAAVRALGAGPGGWTLVAARDNEAAARAIGIWPTGARLAAAALAGALAGAAGAVYAHALFALTPGAFPARASVDVVAMAAVGGLGLAGGPVLGAGLVVALPAFAEGVSSAALAATAFGWLLVLLAWPRGLAAPLEVARRHAVALLLRAAGHDPGLAHPPPAAHSAGSGFHLDLGSRAAAAAPAELRAESLAKAFGGLLAVDRVSLTVAPGEIVGVVGPNGAGKTTLLDLLSGLERPDGGRVALGGEDVTRLPAELRARAGLARSFQDPALFPSLTPRAILGLARRSRRAAVRDPREDALLAALGLSLYADMPVRALSTGTRRVVELAALLALNPRVLVMDEPSAGLARPEAEVLASLLVRLRDETGLGILVVEHDLDVVAQAADRVLALDGGRVVREGPPVEVLA